MYPVKINAVVLVNKEIRHGRLIRPDECSDCGSITKRAIHGHHDDYSKPLEVRWLCAKCHLRWHRENGPGLNSGEGMAEQAVRLKKRYFDKLKEKHCSSKGSKHGDMNISRSIVLFLEIKDWSQGQLAEELGVTLTAVSNMLRRGSCNSDTILKLANVFGVKASAFIKKGES